MLAHDARATATPAEDVWVRNRESAYTRKDRTHRASSSDCGKEGGRGGGRTRLVVGAVEGGGHALERMRLALVRTHRLLAGHSMSVPHMP
eukprot:604014-Rhodomonas_salina.1